MDLFYYPSYRVRDRAIASPTEAKFHFCWHWYSRRWHPYPLTEKQSAYIACKNPKLWTSYFTSSTPNVQGRNQKHIMVGRLFYHLIHIRSHYLLNQLLGSFAIKSIFFRNRICKIKWFHFTILNIFFKLFEHLNRKILMTRKIPFWTYWTCRTMSPALPPSLWRSTWMKAGSFLISIVRW